MSGPANQKAGGHGPVLKPDEARQSIMTGHMRYVLGVSTALAVVMMLIILFVAPPF
jgi:hypothetical protein